MECSKCGGSGILIDKCLEEKTELTRWTFDPCLECVALLKQVVRKPKTHPYSNVRDFLNHEAELQRELDDSWGYLN